MYVCILEKWFTLQGKRAHSLYFLSFQDQNREVGGQNNRPINFLKVITFSTECIYTTSLVPRPSYHGVPVRGPGNNGLRMRLIKTARYA